MSRRVDRVTEADQALRAWQLRIRGVPYREIATEMGVSVGTVSNRLSLFQKDQIEPEVAGLRQLEADRLDDLCRRAYAVLEGEHVVVQFGKVVLDKDGNSLQDQETVLKAINTILRLSEARSKLLGLQAPIQIDALVKDAVDIQDHAIMQIIREAQAKNDRAEAEIKGIRDNPQSEGNAA